MSELTAEFKCDFCRVSMTGHHQYVQHMSGRKHLKKLKNEGVDAESVGADGQPAVVADGQNGSSDDPVQRAVMQNMLGKVPLKRKMNEEKCEVCDVKYDSDAVKTMHLNGAKHAKKMKTMDPNNPNPMNEATFYCSFCNIKVNGADQMDQHRLGDRHKKKLAVAREIQQMTRMEGPITGVVVTEPGFTPPTMQTPTQTPMQTPMQMPMQTPMA